MFSIRLFNRQRKKRINLQKLQRFATQALSELPVQRQPGKPPDEINIVFVSDTRIARLHRKYMSIDGPTDVITFHHGDVFIGVETAAKQAKEFRTSFEYELELYIAHGLLHLCGFEDASQARRRKMQREQERLLAATRTKLS